MCDLIIKETNWNESKQGSIYRDGDDLIDTNTRITDVVFLPAMSVPESILRTAMNVANIQARWNYRLTGVENVQMGRYTIGGHYDYHKDITQPNSKNEQRKLSSVLFLSDPDTYEGGEFEFKYYEFKIPKFPKGTILVFPSFLDHKVNPVTSGERYSAVNWAFGPAFN
jgi:PKHD-type hydroxylase